MVCSSEESFAICVVRDMTNFYHNAENNVKLFPVSSVTVQAFFEEVGRSYQYDPDSFELVLQRHGDNETVTLSENRDKSLKEIGVTYEMGVKNNFIVTELSGPPRRKATTETNEDDMLLGASASPTASGDYAGEYATPPPAAPSLPRAVCSTSKNELTWGCSSIAKHYTVGYVGLVNQAMTCYLNSLLQALFMTPEFRNALYKWEFDGTEQDESKSIPYQLQKLFLQLQTSSKTAVETTELTRSFGWDSSEAWQQHDIQELCRVMFDALEHKFKNTQQADLISRLYEGKMIDYVKCLECSTEKSREDTFLDIPLPVRPYGSEAYGSVEEALRAFVQPETLDGNNQYFCEQCNKKCDAHKGLKFSKFPYLLTLHLKRFDFDYTTLHRIKLNDKVVFPDILDLNSFIINGECKEDEGMLEETIVNKDDSSTTTTDSGSALDDECCHNMEITMNSHETDYQEDDEGIDMSSGPTHQENEKNRRDMLSEKGPYIYELFSIMIHSGSASGGHYYAYIKDFKTMEWFCFNDQTVTRITTEDIKKTYGGGPVRGYYSGAYSSSTNAYMLMYRQIDRSRNCEAMTVKDFPEHIKELLKKMQDKDEQDRLMKEKESEMCKLKLHCRQPAVTDRKMYCMNNETLAEVTKRAYQSLDLEGQVPLEQCRLVSYDSIQDWIECSYEGREDETIHSIMESVHINCKNNMLMEIRKPDETFEVYQKGGVSTRVFVVNLESEDVEGPFSIRGNLSQTVYEFKATIGKILELPVDKMRIVLEKYANEPRPLEDDNRTLKHEGFYGSTKIFVTCCEEDKDTPFMESKLHKIIDRFEHVICLQCVLPDVSKEALEKLQISPDIDVNHNDDNAEADKAAKVLKVNKAAEALLKKKDNLNENVGLWNNSAQPPGDPEDEGIGTTGQSDQSASEDNSLTDSDRTLVGDAPDECHAVLSSHSNSPVISDNPNVSSPEEGDVANNDNGTDILDMIYSQIDTKVKDHKKRLENINFDTSGVGRPPAEADPDISPDNHYFRAIQNTVTENGKLLKVLVDKRMTLGALKKDLEPHVGVPVEYFKIFRLYSSQQEYECARLSESLNSYRDDEQLIIRLGRALRKGEHKGKVYALVPDAKEPAEYICDWIIGKGMKVSDVKKEILEEMKKISGTDMKTYECCRLRKKSWKNPAKVYLDDQIFDDDISLYPNWEIFVQALPYPEPVTSTDQLVVFVRQWCPSAMTLKPFEEIVLDTNKVDELKTKISSISGIHIDNIEIAKAQGTFPCECNILTVHTDLEWSSQVATLDTWPLNIFEDGHVIIYRDKTEELKQLTPEEEKKLSRRDCSRQTKYTPSFSSPRKERALKIYLDSSPKKHDDLDVD